MFIRKFSKFKKNIIQASVGVVVSNTAAFVSTLLLNRYFEKDVFGVLVLFLVVLGTIESLLSFKSWQILLKYSPLLSNFKRANLIYFLFVVDSVLFLFGFTLALIIQPQLFKWYSINDHFFSAYIVITSVLLLRSSELLQAVFRFYGKFDTYSKIISLQSILKVIFLFIYFKLVPNPKLIEAASIIFLVEAIGFIIKIYSTSKVLKDNNSLFSFSRKSLVFFYNIEIRNIAKFNFFDVSFRTITRNLDTLLIGKLSGMETVGTLKIIKDLSNVLLRLVDPITQVIFPNFIKELSIGKFDSSVNLAWKVMKLLSLFILIFYLSFLLFGQSFLSFFFSRDSEAIFQGLKFYLIPISIAIITIPLHPFMLSLGKNKELFKFQIYSNFVYLISLIPLTYYYSIIGASISYFLYYIIWSYLIFSSINSNKNVRNFWCNR